MNETNKPLVHLTIGGFILALSGVAVAYATMGTSAMGFYRMLLGGISLAIVAFVRKLSFATNRKTFFYVCLAGFALALDLYWWHKSIRMVGPGLGAILTNCQSFSLAIFAYFLFKEKITAIYFLSLLMAMLGIGLISGVGGIFNHNVNMSSEYIWGVLLGLASAVAYALCIVSIKLSQSPGRTIHPIVNMVYLCGAATVFLLVTSIIDGESLAIPDSKNFFTLLAYGLVVQGVAWLMVSSSVPHVKTSVAGLILLAEPVGTYLVDIMFFSASPTWISVVGIVLTLAAIYIGSQYGTVKVQS